MADICGDSTAYKDCPVKEILEREIKAVCHKVDLNFRLNEVALQKAERIMDARLESMNEFREQLRAQASMFVTRDAADIRHSEIQRQVDDLRLAKAALDGKASAMSVWIAYGFALFGLLLSVVSLLM